MHKHEGIHEWEQKADNINLPGFRGYQCRRCHGTAWMAQKKTEEHHPPPKGCVDILPMEDRYQHRDYDV